MKKLAVIISCFMLCGCSQSIIQEGEGVFLNDNGESTTAKIKMKDSIIQEVELDETTKDSTKKTLKDEYGMKVASSIGKEWYEQVHYFEDYVQKHGIDKIALNDEGKATNEDIISGCTIRIDGFLNAISDVEKNIKSQE